MDKPKKTMCEQLDSTKNLFTCRIFILILVLYSFQYNDLSNSLLVSFDKFWLFFSGKVTTGVYNSVSLIEKSISLGSSLVVSSSLLGKTQCFVHLSFNFVIKFMAFQLISKIT